MPYYDGTCSDCGVEVGKRSRRCSVCADKEVRRRGREATRARQDAVRASREALTPESRIYFVEAIGIDAVKIGVSVNVADRMKGFITHCPVPVRLLFVIQGGQLAEIALHRRFAHARLRGEWFKLSAIKEELERLDVTQAIPEYVPRCMNCGAPKRSNAKRLRVDKQIKRLCYACAAIKRQRVKIQCDSS